MIKYILIIMVLVVGIGSNYTKVPMVECLSQYDATQRHYDENGDCWVQKAHGQEMFMCFATKELADDFLNQFPDADVTIGCPEFNLSEMDKNRTQDEGK